MSNVQSRVLPSSKALRSLVLSLAVTALCTGSALAQSGSLFSRGNSGNEAGEETLSARTQVRLDSLSRSLAEATGRIETLEGALAQQTEETKRLTQMVDTLGATLSQLKAGGPAPVTDTPEQALGPVVDGGRVELTSPSGDKSDLFTAPTPPPLSPDVWLTNAQTALQGGNYQGAEANLTQLIWLYPTSPQASEGRWLLGEARYVQAAWGSAAQAYVDYLKVSPQGPRASEALLRLAGVFRQLGDTNQRCLALAEFKRRTPKPDPTLKARADAEIARMSCTTP
ncbi:MAG: hypothetical protein RL186_93 [Pseudomonadota bacterium]|jgi:TolA-binding protein